MIRTALLLALACTIVATPLAAGPADDATTQPSTQPVREAIDVKDFARLREMIGTEVTIRGTVTEVFVPRSASVSIFNFDGIDRRAFNVVVPQANLEAVNAGFDGDVARTVKGRTIAVTGTIVDYRGNPQIQLTAPQQLKVEAERPAEGERAEPTVEDEIKDD